MSGANENGGAGAGGLPPGVVPDAPAPRALPAVGEEIEIGPSALPAGIVPDGAGRARSLPAIGEEVAIPPGFVPTTTIEAPPEPDLDDRIRAAWQLGLQINPTEQAGVNHLARTLDLPPAIVAQAYPHFQKAAEAVQFDPARFRREYPGLVEQFFENPQGAIHPKQAEQLSGFTRALSALWKFSAEHPLLGASAIPLVPGSAAIAPALSAGELMDLEDEMVGREGTRESRTVKLEPLKQVRTRQSELKGRTGLETTLAIANEERKRGLLQNELGEVGFGLLVAHQLGENTDLLRRRQIEIEQELGVQVDYGQNALEQLAIDAEKGVMSQWQTVKEGGKGYAVGLGLGTVAGVAETRSPATEVLPVSEIEISGFIARGTGREPEVLESIERVRQAQPALDGFPVTPANDVLRAIGAAAKAGGPLIVRVSECAGGHVLGVIAILRRLLRYAAETAPVVTYGSGRVASSAPLLLLGGTVRIVDPAVQILLHSCQVPTPAGWVQALELNEFMVETCAAATTTPRAVLEDAFAEQGVTEDGKMVAVLLSLDDALKWRWAHYDGPFDYARAVARKLGSATKSNAIGGIQ